MKGIVVLTTGSLHTVRTENGQEFRCLLKGIFRIKGLKATNPIAVGDQVTFEPPGEHEAGQITRIEKRKNYIIRKATKLSKTVHILAANIDNAFLVATLAFPRTSTGFIDRFLVTAEAYKIPVTIVFNKTDIYNEELEELHHELVSLYEGIGYPCLGVSALSGSNLDLLASAIKNKVSLIAGHSGVGKSALLNALDSGLQLKTSEVSLFHQKGKHTTTFSEMHPLSFGGFVIDTPGIKEFGLVDFYREELTHYFPEMFALLPECQFHNCTHIHEPGCAVISGLDSGKVSPIRYTNYVNIFHGRELEKENE